MRLDKYLSNYSGLSRKEAKQAIKLGDVLVDQVPAAGPEQTVSEHQDIRLGGMRIAPRGPRYFMLNKPVGCVCANSDPQHPTVIALFAEEEDVSELHVAGRLDLDTTGLVLVTDDGHWSHRVTSPKHKMPKRYQVTLQDPIADDAAARFAEGILLRNEHKRTRPASLQVNAPQQVELTIYEGKYHQVKRMFAAIGNHVVALHRAAIGPVVLDPQLQPGEYRPLHQEEIERLS
ncbi:16S rRNA pseudouridine(516) synthase RsuA [Ketobacter sp.]|uniref:16S rRNA pseudouridine(516) synthase RsuA n=1 Tax=Ketobacter sp. TaxID=2083498 RepID=UPI000F22ADA0|nr:16S rRNA pseudouridine(516) synthase RsuA [Ketobacter sp.]RLT92094.1 MAG: 16S rRNA pseudouridine(516) synthase RsuA [Ketobacter sp.]